MDEDTLLAVAAVLAVKSCKKKKRVWCKRWLLKRSEFSHVNLLDELILEPDDWRNYLRMDEDCYQELLNMVTPFIQKQDTNLRRSISPHERLSATLRFLATGRSYSDLKISVIISPQALSYIIPDTCAAIIKTLGDYIKLPRKEAEWSNIANEFYNRWNFPNSLGAVDGKHVRITPPKGSGSYFYNYKGYHSLVLLAICNANYEFIYCDFGTNGRISDGGVIENTIFYEKLKEHSLNIPPASAPENSNSILPFVFVGDDAFALRNDFLKPFPQQGLTHERRIFNYRLSRARRVIENSFGILANRFRIFHTAINLELKNIDNVVLACCYLHNYLRKKSTEPYTTPSCHDHENHETGEISLGLRTGDTMNCLQNGPNRHFSNEAKKVQDDYLKYFNNEGAVLWQNKFI